MTKKLKISLGALALISFLAVFGAVYLSRDKNGETASNNGFHGVRSYMENVEYSEYYPETSTTLKIFAGSAAMRDKPFMGIFRTPTAQGLELGKVRVELVTGGEVLLTATSRKGLYSTQTRKVELSGELSAALRGASITASKISFLPGGLVEVSAPYTVTKGGVAAEFKAAYRGLPEALPGL